LYFGFFVLVFLSSVPVQVIAWRTVSEMTYNVSSGTLNLTHSLRPFDVSPTKISNAGENGRRRRRRHLRRPFVRSCYGAKRPGGETSEVLNVVVPFSTSGSSSLTGNW